MDDIVGYARMFGLFDNERLEAAAKEGGLDEILNAVSEFCGSTPLTDDCTVMEMVFSG